MWFKLTIWLRIDKKRMSRKRLLGIGYKAVLGVNYRRAVSDYR